MSTPSFSELGLCETLSKICEERGWTKPTPIQIQAIPPALERHDVIGLAQTGSGKTGAFALPILNDLLLHNRPCPTAVILAPTRFLRYHSTFPFNVSLICNGQNIAS